MLLRVSDCIRVVSNHIHLYCGDTSALSILERS
jgi:hypothetical protein